VLEFYGTIAEDSWFDDDITPEMFKAELFAGTGPVTIWINSPGGDCNAASQIYAALMDYKGEVTVKIDGMAASAASVIAMAGTKVLMAPTAMMMIHNPAKVVFEEGVEVEGLSANPLNKASADTLGGIKVGDGLSIDSDGILSADGITPAANQADSTASTVATLKDDFNALLAKLKTAGLMEADEETE
jgi:hypothetical protein